MTRALIALLLLAAPASADLFVVRHAEKKNPKMDASTLSSTGFKRAKSLAKVLADVPLTAVFVTEYERTAQTAAPTAAAHGLKPTVVKSDDLDGLLKAVRALPPGADALVVGHTDTIPDLLKALGVAPKIELASGDYDNLFVVSLSTPAAFHRLHY